MVILITPIYLSYTNNNCSEVKSRLHAWVFKILPIRWRCSHHQPSLQVLQHQIKIFHNKFLDRINGSTFEWTKMRRCGSQECLVTFNSQMISSFEMPRSPQIFPHSETYLIETPIILGGFFMIHRKRFVKLGGFDNELRIWGGENIDISCGFSNSS